MKLDCPSSIIMVLFIFQYRLHETTKSGGATRIIVCKIKIINSSYNHSVSLFVVQ